MVRAKSAPFLKLLLISCCILSGIGLSARSWKEITRTKTLQVLIIDADRSSSSGFGLHRVEMPMDRQQILLRKFANEHNLRIEYRSAPEFKALFAMLDMGQGDLIASNLAETPERKKRYLLTEPFFCTREMIFTAKDSKIKGSDVSALKGRQGKVLPGTTYAANLRALAAKHKDIRFRELATSLSHEDLIEQVASGKIAYSVLNECDLDAWLAYRHDVRKLFPLRRKVPLVFAARKEDTVLVSRLNKFITVYNSMYKNAKKADPKKKRAASSAPASTKKDAPKGLRTDANTPPEFPESPEENSSYEEATQIVSSEMTGDLDEIRERGYIRMLTSNNAFCCYLQKGSLAGFEYELATRFAEALNVVVVTVIPENFQDLLQYLADGKGDFIAANFTRTADRVQNHPELTFCAPYFPVAQVLVGRPGEKISKPEDLNGRTVHVLPGSSYVDTLRELQQKGIDLRIVFTPGDQQTLTIIRDVASRKYDLTIADETFLQMAVEGGCKVRKYLTLSEKQSYSWVVRKDNPKLAAAVNAYFRKENRSTFFNLCRKRYYSPQTARAVAPYVFKDRQLVISPYDSLFRKYGKLYDFDWYFLAAQSFQESRFQADRVNHLGAAGLMQVLPAAAKEVGISDLTKPENGICAGTRYLAKLRKKFSQLTPENQLCFSLASYNAGYGHIQDARKLAAMLKLDPNVWFGSTERALVMLEDPRYYSRTKFGFCRAAETVPYVQNIMFYNYHYRQMLQIDEGQKQKEKPAPGKN